MVSLPHTFFAADFTDVPIFCATDGLVDVVVCACKLEYGENGPPNGVPGFRDDTGAPVTFRAEYPGLTKVGCGNCIPEKIDAGLVGGGTGTGVLPVGCVPPVGCNAIPLTTVPCCGILVPVEGCVVGVGGT